LDFVLKNLKKRSTIIKFAYNVQVFVMAGHFVFHYAGAEADFCFVAEDNYKVKKRYVAMRTEAE
jgi:hypothetical protein